MTSVLVLIERANGELKNTTAELLAVASAFGTPTAAVIGAPGTTAGFTDTLASYGADEILAAESDDATKYLITPEVSVFVGLASEHEVLALVSASAAGREIAGHVTTLTGSGLLSDVIAINDDVSARYSIFGGEYIVDDAGHSTSPAYALHPGSVDPEGKSGSAGAAKISLPEIGNNAVEIVSFAPAEGGDRPELTEAKLIVSGGHGVASGDGSKNVVKPVASALGVTIGASHAAVDTGYYPDQSRVGQTDKTVSPDLYLAPGISGAIQHKAGIQTSKAIVVVNKDGEAPLFEIADFDVTGSLFDVVPQAIENLK